MSELISTIYNIDNRSVLYEVADEVVEGDDIEAIIRLMRYAMYNNRPKGIGLAAPQIGLKKRLILIHTPAFQKVILNPVITKQTEKLMTSEEGCLSFPGKLVEVKRFKRITVEGFCPDWEPMKIKLSNLESAVIQHEIDHLNGITITSRTKT